MRVLIVNALYPPLTTGSSHFTADLVSELRARGHLVHVVTTVPSPKDAEGIVDDPDVTRLPARWVSPGEIAFNYAIPVLRRGAGRVITRLIREWKPDVVSIHGQVFDLSWRAAVAARRAGVPVVVSVHSAIRHTNVLADRILSLGELVTVRPALARSSTWWIAVDKRTYEHASERYGVPSERLAFAPVMLAADAFRGGDASRARARFDLGNDPVLLSLGHVVPVRDRIALVRAMPEILRVHPDLKLVIVGELYTKTFMDVADELGVTRSIITTGRVSHDWIPDLLAAARAEIHDLQGIGLGITSLEAMAASVPIVAHVPEDNYPGASMGEWPGLVLIDDVEPHTIAGAVLRLLADDDHRAAVVAEQHRFVDALFSPASVTKRYEVVFDSAVRSVRTRGGTQQ